MVRYFLNGEQVLSEAKNASNHCATPRKNVTVKYINPKFCNRSKLTVKNISHKNMRLKSGINPDHEPEILSVHGSPPGGFCYCKIRVNIFKNGVDYTIILRECKEKTRVGKIYSAFMERCIKAETALEGDLFL